MLTTLQSTTLYVAATFTLRAVWPQWLCIIHGNHNILYLD